MASPLVQRLADARGTGRVPRLLAGLETDSVQSGTEAYDPTTAADPTRAFTALAMLDPEEISRATEEGDGRDPTLAELGEGARMTVDAFSGAAADFPRAFREEARSPFRFVPGVSGERGGRWLPEVPAFPEIPDGGEIGRAIVGPVVALVVLVVAALAVLSFAEGAGKGVTGG